MTRLAWILILTSVIVLRLTIFNFWSQFLSSAHPGDEISAWAAVTPTIDGFIETAEWASADNLTYTTEGGVSGLFFAMNDGKNLYMAVVTPDPTLSMNGAGTDAVMVYFDNDHDGVGPESGDDIVGWTGYLSEGFRDGFSDGTYVWRRDTDFGGVSNGTAVAISNGTHNHFEFMHPLNTADDAHDFSLSMSNTTGFAIRLTVDGADQGFWPSSDPALWGNLAIFRPVLSAWSSNTPMIDGKLNPAYVLLGTPVPAEWEDAARVNFILSWGTESHNASLYVMNDYVNLYLALVVENEDQDFDDYVMFNFDNDNDGVKELGDDILYVDGQIFDRLNLRGRFQDGFWLPPGAGLVERDTIYGGDEDGVGASRFTGPKLDGTYVFEVAHPLDTSDDLYDFSLNVDDKVGFNVLYFDQGGGVDSEDGWPTFTQSEWLEMAEIEIAGPPAPPPVSAVNLRIDQIEITQAIQWLDDPPNLDNSLPLARGKSTVVRVYLNVAVLYDVPVEVFLYAIQSGWSLACPGKFGPYGPMRQSFIAPAAPDRGNENHTADFLLPDYWVTGGHVTLVAFVKAPAGQSETDYTDNWMSRETFFFTLTKSLRIGYYLIDYRPTAPDASPNLPSPAKVQNGKVFFEKVTPMPDLIDPVDYYPLGPPIVWDQSNFTDADGKFNETAQEELLFLLAEIWLDMDDPPDQICGLFANALTRIGQAAGGDVPTSNVFVAHEDRPWSFAHEIGHNYGFPHSWLDGDNPWQGMVNENSSQTYGYDTQANWAPGEPGDIVKVPAIIVAPPPDGYGALMSYHDDYRWTSPYTWEELVTIFDPPESLSVSLESAAQGDSSSLRISGVIYADNTGVLNPVFQMPYFRNLTVPTGPYAVELRGPPPAETLIYSQSFDLSFEPEACTNSTQPLDRALFMLDLPATTGIYSVSIWNNTASPPVLLDKITASSSPPSVTVTYPNGRETVGNTFTATWTASDPDADPLTFKLQYSSDNGLTWRPLATRLRGTSYQVDASVLQGGSQCLIRVLASDGFHTSEDQSDAVFNVPLKGPMNVVGIGVGPCNTYSLGEPILLKGSAFDPEDGVLNGSALTWTSNLDGFLGNGSVLAAIDLRPGVHNITLTATDSHGNNATDSFTVTVEFHNVILNQVTLDQTTAYAGQTITANFTVANGGNVVEAFDVSAHAISSDSTMPSLSIGNQSVTGLPPDANLNLTFSWNTTGILPGNYTLSGFAPPVPGEFLTGDNYLAINVLVKLVGDINGDMKVDMRDIGTAARAFGTEPAHPDWNPDADITGPEYLIPDRKVDMRDIGLAARHFGETYP